MPHSVVSIRQTSNTDRDRCIV